MKYPQVYDGDKLFVEHGQILKVMCCDCGLVHDYAIAKTRGGFTVRLWRNGKATGNARRRKQEKS